MVLILWSVSFVYGLILAARSVLDKRNKAYQEEAGADYPQDYYYGQ